MEWRSGVVIWLVGRWRGREADGDGYSGGTLPCLGRTETGTRTGRSPTTRPSATNNIMTEMPKKAVQKEA